MSARLMEFAPFEDVDQGLIDDVDMIPGISYLAARYDSQWVALRRRYRRVAPDRLNRRTHAIHRVNLGESNVVRGPSTADRPQVEVTPSITIVVIDQSASGSNRGPWRALPTRSLHPIPELRCITNHAVASEPGGGRESWPVGQARLWSRRMTFWFAHRHVSCGRGGPQRDRATSLGWIGATGLLAISQADPSVVGLISW